MSEQSISLTLDGEGVIGVNDLNEYAEVIRRAFAIHVDRERTRHGLWKEYPAEDQARQVKIKADRIEHSLRIAGEQPHLYKDLTEEVLKELDDVINYSVFTARKLEGNA